MLLNAFLLLFIALFVYGTDLIKNSGLNNAAAAVRRYRMPLGLFVTVVSLVLIITRVPAGIFWILYFASTFILALCGLKLLRGFLEQQSKYIWVQKIIEFLDYLDSFALFADKTKFFILLILCAVVDFILHFS